MRDGLSKIDTTTSSLEKIFPDAQDFLPLLGTDYVEFYVGNAKQAAHFYKTALGWIVTCIIVGLTSALLISQGVYGPTIYKTVCDNTTKLLL